MVEGSHCATVVVGNGSDCVLRRMALELCERNGVITETRVFRNDTIVHFGVYSENHLCVMCYVCALLCTCLLCLYQAEISSVDVCFRDLQRSSINSYFKK